MRKLVKALAVMSLALLFVVVAFGYDKVAPIMGSFWAAVQANTTFLTVMSVIAIVLLFIVLPLLRFLSKKWDLKLFGKLIGTGAGKLYPVADNLEAALEFVRESGTEDYAFQSGGRTLHRKLQRLSPSTADVQIAMFLISSSPIRLTDKRMIEEIPDHDRHFVYVDRRTNEVVSGVPNILTWDSAMEEFKTLLMEGIPLELKKKPLDKMMEERMRAAFAEETVKDMVGHSQRPQAAQQPQGGVTDER